MKKLLRLTLILCFIMGALTVTANALAGAAPAPIEEKDMEVTVYDVLNNDAYYKAIELKLDSYSGARNVTVGYTTLVYNPQRDLYIGIVGTDYINGNMVHAKIYDFEPANFVYGNLHGDIITSDYTRSVTSIDLLHLKQALAGQRSLDDDEFFSADVDLNGKITVGDLQQFKLFLSKETIFEAIANVPTTYSYGYISDIRPGSAGGLNTVPYTLRFSYHNGLWRYIPLTYDIEYDGESLSPASGAPYLMDAAKSTNYDMKGSDANAITSQIVKYSLEPATGKIATIATVKNFAPDYTEDKLNGAYLDYTQDPDGSFRAVEYIPIDDESGYFDILPKFVVDKDTTVFVVSNDRSDVKRSTVAQTFSAGKKYLIELFDRTGWLDDGKAKVCVVYRDRTLDALSASTPLYLIDSIVSTQTRNNQGEVGEKADVFVTGESVTEETVLSANPETFTNWGTGTVVKMLENKYGDICTDADGSQVIWNPKTQTKADEWINKEPAELNGTYYQTLLGEAVSYDDETGVLTLKDSKQITLNEKCKCIVYDMRFEDDPDPIYEIHFEELSGNLPYSEDDTSVQAEVLVHLEGESAQVEPTLVYIVIR